MGKGEIRPRDLMHLKLQEEARWALRTETSGGLGEEAGQQAGGKEVEGTDFLHTSQEPPGAAGGVREALECQTFHSSELASAGGKDAREHTGLPKRGIDHVRIPALKPRGCVFSSQSLNLSGQEFPNLQNGGHSHSNAGGWEIWQDSKTEMQQVL